MPNINEKKLRKEILKIWDHAGYTNEVEARVFAKELENNEEAKKLIKKGEKISGITAGRQLQHPQVGEAFGKDGVLGAISNNVDGISVKNIITKNSLAAKKINAGLLSKIIIMLIKNNNVVAFLLPEMWKPIINYFLGKLFGDRKVKLEDYKKGIKGITINENVITKEQLLEEGLIDNTRGLLLKANNKVIKPSIKLIGYGVGTSKKYYNSYKKFKNDTVNDFTKLKNTLKHIGHFDKTVYDKAVEEKMKPKKANPNIETVDEMLGKVSPDPKKDKDIPKQANQIKQTVPEYTTNYNTLTPEQNNYSSYKANEAAKVGLFNKQPEIKTNNTKLQEKLQELQDKGFRVKIK